jgi:hypothetical protein
MPLLTVDAVLIFELKMLVFLTLACYLIACCPDQYCFFTPRIRNR